MDVCICIYIINFLTDRPRQSTVLCVCDLTSISFQENCIQGSPHCSNASRSLRAVTAQAHSGHGTEEMPEILRSRIGKLCGGFSAQIFGETLSTMENDCTARSSPNEGPAFVLLHTSWHQ